MLYDWNKNDITISDITAPLTRQELADIYEPSKTQGSISASGKLLRFVMEDKSIIKSQDDWYDYIKEKIDALVADEDMIKETNYKFISLEKIDDIDGHYAVREDYTDRENLRGRDFYIFNDDIYQFVFESNINVFDNYISIFDKIAASLKLSK